MTGTLSLDFSSAAETPCHRYTGVRASIDGAPRQIITLSPDGCAPGTVDGPSTSVGTPTVDPGQAWATVVMLTGRGDVRPVGEGCWDPQAMTLSFQLRRGRAMVAGTNPLPAS